MATMARTRSHRSILGDAPAIAALRAQIRHLAAFDTPGNPHVPTVLLQGETGTGKGLVARVIHDSGGRARAGPFVDVNCAAIPETMLEAELFGFEAGAFTDARRAKPGLFEAAAGGSLFLDEVDALPLVAPEQAAEGDRGEDASAASARVAPHRVDVEAHRRDAAATCASWSPRGRFRADLYHRLAVVILDDPAAARARRRRRRRSPSTSSLATRAAHGVAPQAARRRRARVAPRATPGRATCAS